MVLRIMQRTLTRPRKQKIQSVQRAAAILRAFGGGAPELGVGELSRQLALHKSTVSRLLSTLEYEGLVERVEPGDKYRLGFEFARLAGKVPHFADLRTVARPLLHSLARAANETVHLAVRDGDSVINLEQISGAHLVRDTNWVGRRTPFHCVANGKALLAYFSASDVERLTAGPLTRFTPRTITDRAGLRRELEWVRRHGYAQARGEVEEGLNAVAAPVFDPRGHIVAAVSVSGPAYRLRPSLMRALGELTKSYAAQISMRLQPESDSDA
jgi:DNA-binding IclR family transcriptional regulator